MKHLYLTFFLLILYIPSFCQTDYVIYNSGKGSIIAQNETTNEKTVKPWLENVTITKYTFFKKYVITGYDEYGQPAGTMTFKYIKCIKQII